VSNNPEGKLMRIFLVLICSLALACVAGAQEETGKKKEEPKKKPAHAEQARKPTGAGKPTGTGKPAEAATATTAGKLTATGKATAKGKPFKAQHFNLPTKTPPTKVAAVNFQQGRHIQGSQNWQGSNYTVFRNYSSQWHDRNWWSGHYNRVVFVYGGWYAWNAGYWIPAWGYAPNAYYAYDGPIYGYNRLPPDQVIANVQTALQQQGYYQGEVDGLLGPQTRAAITDYQRANGLVETAAIDQPTLESLGMA
jgi:Putative peptidoglycan binding domain